MGHIMVYDTYINSELCCHTETGSSEIIAFCFYLPCFTWWDTAKVFPLPLTCISLDYMEKCLRSFYLIYLRQLFYSGNNTFKSGLL